MLAAISSSSRYSRHTLLQVLQPLQGWLARLVNGCVVVICKHVMCIIAIMPHCGCLQLDCCHIHMCFSNPTTIKPLVRLRADCSIVKPLVRLLTDCSMKPLPCCTWSCRDSTRPTATLVADPSSSSATPLTPSQALKAHSHALTGYEQSEILNQQDIYFLGLGADKIEGQPHSSDLNHGYVTSVFPCHACMPFLSTCTPWTSCLMNHLPLHSGMMLQLDNAAENLGQLSLLMQLDFAMLWLVILYFLA